MLIPCKYACDRDRLKIRERCEQLNISIAIMTEELGYSYASVLNWNNGYKSARMDRIIDLAILLKCEPGDLIHAGATMPVKKTTCTLY